MKKFLSIFIAMLLIVSLFATTAVAFAAEDDQQEPSQSETTEPTTPGEGGEEEEEKPEEPHPEIIIHYDILDTYLKDGCSWFEDVKVEMGDIKFGQEMMKSSSKIGEAFENIKYVISGDEDYDSKKADNDKIYIEYCRPSESPKGQKTWQNSSLITENIRLSSTGWYVFRIVIKDKNNEVLVTSDKDHYYRYYAEDTSRPVVSLSTTMKNKQESGLTEGVKYSIPTSGLTSGSTDEMSSTTVNYEVYKVVNGADVLIYDSVTKKVTEGYEDYIDVDGAITPSKDDISDETVYKVIYSVKDAYGYTGVQDKADIQNYTAQEYRPAMLLKVVAAPAETEKKSSVNVWEIILFCIAGLSAVGIVVLLCVKPKEAAPSRVAPASANEAEQTEQAEQTEE